MNDSAELHAWKIFLKGRIAQEQGKEQEALEAFDEALRTDPKNPYFLNSKTIALRNLKRPDDALLAQVRKAYGELATRHTGENDKPGPWIEGLRSLLGEVESQKKADESALVASVAW